MKELFTRNDGTPAIIGVENGKYYVEYNGIKRTYAAYTRALNFLQKNGFCIALKKIVK